MKNIDKLLNIWAKFSVLPLKMLKKKNQKGLATEKLFISLSKKAEEESNVFVSHFIRPKFNIYENDLPDFQTNSLAIVMQGPILRENNFTLETCKWYKSINKNYIIIVSTWNNEDDSYLEEFRKIGVDVVLSESPRNGGYGNINYQIVSMQSGIRFATSYKVDFVCKTRTDQRIYGKYSFEMIMDLIKEFPVAVNNKLTNRLAVLATEYGSMFEPYYFSDFFFLGKSSDMKLLLDIELDNRDKFNRIGLSRYDVVEKKAIAEVYIHKSLANNIDKNYGNSIKEYWKYIQDNLILFDKSTIQLYWPKYDTRYCEHIRNGVYSTLEPNEKNRNANFNFSSWLCLVKNQLEYKEEYENYLKLPL